MGELADRTEVSSGDDPYGYIAAFQHITEVLALDDSTARQLALVEMAGGADRYNSLVEASSAFTQRHPGLFEDRIPAPHIFGLWLGLIVAAEAERP